MSGPIVRALLASLALLTAAPGHAADWAFGPTLSVSGPARPGVFPHLEAAGRASIAVSGGTVAVVWEDNRSGRPAAYVAFKGLQALAFSEPRRLSGRAQAYEPAVAALGGGFVFAWEEDGRVRLRTGAPDQLGPTRAPGWGEGAQATLAAAPDGTAWLAFGATAGGRPHILVARLENRGGALRLSDPRPVEAEPPPAGELYPALAATPAGLNVAWEDRREGHSRIYHAFAPAGGHFGAAGPINELLPSRSGGKFGRGTGVTRVSLAADRKQRLAALWMDKRYFRGGYKVYAALSQDGGEHFGGNEAVQDEFGDNVPQWHPDVAVSPSGQVVAAWDDRRDDTSDVWFSWRLAAGEWSDDRGFAPAYGPGDQTHPVIAFGPQGVLHAAWVERGADGRSAVRYAAARPPGR